MDIWSKFVKSKDTPAVYFFFAFIRSICNGNALTSGLFRSVRPNHHFEKLKFFFLGLTFGVVTKKLAKNQKVSFQKPKQTATSQMQSAPIAFPNKKGRTNKNQLKKIRKKKKMRKKMRKKKKLGL